MLKLSYLMSVNSMIDNKTFSDVFTTDFFPKDIRLMVWNILAPVWIRQSIYEDIPRELLATNCRIRKIIQTIRIHNPDVLCILESQPSLIKQIVETLNIKNDDDKNTDPEYVIMYSVHNKDNYFSEWSDADDLMFPEYRKEENGMCLIIKKDSNINITDLAEHVWESGNVNMTFKMNGVKIFLAHLDAQDNRSQTTQLSSLLDHHDIILGDFNSEMKEVQKILSSKNIEYFSALDMNEKLLITCADSWISQFIDNILVLRNSAELIRIHNKKYVHKNILSDSIELIQDIGSDHVPVITVIRQTNQ